MKVRCVEDDGALSVLISRMLGRVGVDVDCYRSIRAVPSDWEGIDAALVDMVLPGEPGTVLLRRLQSEHPHVRRVLMSGWGPGIRVEPQMHDVVHAFLWKPFDAIALHQALGIAPPGGPTIRAPGASWIAMATRDGAELPGTRVPLVGAVLLLGTGEDDVVGWHRLETGGH